MQKRQGNNRPFFNLEPRLSGLCRYVDFLSDMVIPRSCNLNVQPRRYQRGVSTLCIHSHKGGNGCIFLITARIKKDTPAKGGAQGGARCRDLREHGIAVPDDAAG